MNMKNNMNIEKKCLKCKWEYEHKWIGWKEEKKSIHLCRRMPEIIYGRLKTHTHPTVTENTVSCGEFQPKRHTKPIPQSTNEEKITKALTEAITIIYLQDNSDYLSSLWEIVKILATPEQYELSKDPKKLMEQLNEEQKDLFSENND